MINSQFTLDLTGNSTTSEVYPTLDYAYGVTTSSATDGQLDQGEIFLIIFASVFGVATIVGIILCCTLCPRNSSSSSTTTASRSNYSRRDAQDVELQKINRSVNAPHDHLAVQKDSKEQYTMEDRSINGESNDELVLGEKLGEGAFGIVFKGVWKSKVVAIKQLRLDYLSPKTLVEFQKETQIMTKLNSPYIVQFFGAIEKSPYSIIMEYMAGGSLYKLLHSSQIISWVMRNQMAAEIIQGLIYLHREKIIHRDLKSPNVLLDEDQHIKLGDFGLAKIKSETGNTTTADSKNKGTLAWLAP